MDGKDEMGLKQVFEKAIPSSLDDIIRVRRSELFMRLSTAEDFAELPPMVSILDEQKQVKTTVNEWRIVCLDQRSVGKREFVLTGIDAKTDRVLATSLVKSVDFENHLLLTGNSLYRLGTKGEGEPTCHILLHLCHVFHKWGLGVRFGVPHVLY